MSAPEDDPPTREELLAAKRDLTRQLELLENPVRGRNRNPPLIARLRAMLAEVNACLADLEEG